MKNKIHDIRLGYYSLRTGAHRVTAKPIVSIVRRGEYATTTFCKQVQLQWWVKNPPETFPSINRKQTEKYADKKCKRKNCMPLPPLPDIIGIYYYCWFSAADAGVFDVYQFDKCSIRL